MPDPDDVSSNRSGNPPLREVAAGRFSRRSVLSGGVAAAAFGFLGGSTALAGTAAAAPVHRPSPGPALGFTAVSPGVADTVRVPDGYVAEVLIPWGTPLAADGPAWKLDASNTAEEQAVQIGMHHDGMHYFPLGSGARGSRRGLLVVNHEYVDAVLLTPDGDEVMTPEKVAKALAAHGVSVVEIGVVDGRWQLLDSVFNRRITGLTPMGFSGPVGADHPELQAQNPPVGTLNNCAMGHTPWDTYLACEENWNGYFGTGDAGWTPTPLEERYGVTAGGFDYRWHTVDPRFDLAVNPKELNRFGWVVEIDPFDPSSTPVKRTALGRTKHEGALVTESHGRVVVYLGDDQDGDYAYKFVGDGHWRRRLDDGESPLDHGTLYVARFADDGSGEWLPLVHGTGPLTPANGWADQAAVLLGTRLAADAVGATPLDRPEWITVHPDTRELFIALTNGTTGPTAVSPRSPNPYGHIVRWRETGDDHTATTFAWEVFLLAGDPAYDPGTTLDEGDIFGSPDGLWFDPDGRLWIQTDVSNSAQLLADRGYDRIGNNQMVVADPTSGEIRRFLTGPVGCEITGVVPTPDQQTMFVNVQHPGESTAAVGSPTPENPHAVSNWPDHLPGGRPRSSTVVIRRIGGGTIGT